MKKIDIKSLSVHKIKKKLKENQTMISIVLASLFVISVIYTTAESSKDKVTNGVKIDGIKISNLTKKEAIEKINKEKEKEIKNSEVKFLLSDKIYTVPITNMGYSLNVEESVNKAYDISHKGNVISKYFKILGAGILRKDIELEEKFSEEKINIAVSNLSKKIYKEPQNAELIYRDGKAKILDESNGRKLDEEKTKQMLELYLETKEDIELPIEKLKPKVYRKDFEGINTALGAFSTNYSRSSENRKENIAMGAGFFNGLMVKPGEEISFNETVGGITSEQGFKKAGVIVNGEIEEGIGGGICQVSTTLYNALLMSNIEIVQRMNHSRPVGYVPMGLDASVVTGKKDLKFKNNTEYPIYIRTSANGTELQFVIFGNEKAKEYDIELIPKRVSVIEPKVIEKYSSEVPKGQKKIEKPGAKGYYYETYAKYSKNGKVVETKRISTSNYIAKNRIELIGTKEDDD